MAFEEIGTIDIADIAQAVGEHRHLFADVTFRQDHPASAHRDTETIYLRMTRDITVETVFEGMEAVDYPACRIRPFRTAMEEVGNLAGKAVARVMIVNLLPGGRIAPHIDQGSYAEATDRYHLPIATNDGAWLRIGSERRHLETGTVYRFDKHQWHEGGNDGPANRIHMVVDLWR